jgi:hypothetical protein
VETREFIQDIRLKRVPVPGLREAKATIAAVETIYAANRELQKTTLTA